jgi:hypothetical protein
VYEVTYSGQATTYWEYIVTGQDNIDDIAMTDCNGNSMNAGSEPSWDPSKSDGGLCDRIEVQGYSDAACTTTTDCVRKASGFATTVKFPQVDWRGATDQQLRLRRACAYQSMMNPSNFTNLVYYRGYTPGTFGAPYSNGETWSFTKQTDSGACFFGGCAMGDTTVSVSATVSEEQITVPAGTFNCYKITFNNGDYEWWDKDGVFPYAPIKLTVEDFDSTQTSVLYSSPLLP